jgi:hypothetical protein
LVYYDSIKEDNDNKIYYEVEIINDEFLECNSVTESDNLSFDELIENK